ncbi:DUF1294 domain-containing protein [Bacillus subtilis subsp. subtilis]|nr:DUF1294 domain-containing protein [Bacillus subtilis subsp. subtilis]
MIHARRYIALAAVGAVIGATTGGLLPPWLGAWYLLTSTVAFGLYGHDKRAARRGRWRTPERTLQLLAFAGGWPGALLGQSVFRHKHRKAAFQWVFVLCVVANIASLVVLLRA